MKKNYLFYSAKFYRFLILNLFFFSNIHAQIDLANYEIIAAYPFSAITQYTDTTGNNPDAIHINTNISNDGVYLNGIYYGINNYSHLEMNVQNFDLSDFVISFDYKLTEVNHPILTTTSSRWFAVFHWSNNLSINVVLNGNNIYHQTFVLEQNSPINVFKHVDIQYVDSTRVLKVYLDGNLKLHETLPDPLYFNNDHSFTTTHYGYGENFKGYLKNLTFYAKTPTLSISNIAATFDKIRIYPNYEENTIIINNASGYYAFLYHLSGQLIAKTYVNKAHFKWDAIQELEGIYIVRLTNDKQIISKKIIVNRNNL